MKTITLKADDQLDATVSRLARKLKRTKSAVIRDAILNYESYLEKEALKQKVKEASLLIRAQSLRVAEDLRESVTDGL